MERTTDTAGTVAHRPRAGRPADPTGDRVRAALGVADLSGRDGTGRVALVVLGAGGRRPDGAGGTPAFSVRLDVDLVGGARPRRPFHAAVGRAPAEAARLVAAAGRAADAAGRVALGAVVELAGPAEAGVAVVALPVDPSDLEVLDAPLADVLASHARVHEAERALFRRSLARAAEALGLEVLRHGRRPTAPAAAAQLAAPPDAVEAFLAGWGAAAGRPWRKEHREAALAAWMALAVR